MGAIEQLPEKALISCIRRFAKRGRQIREVMTEIWGEDKVNEMMSTEGGHHALAAAYDKLKQEQAGGGQLEEGPRKVVIYGLYDPLDNSLRYIGQTRRDLSERLSQHLLSPSNARVAVWFKELETIKARPVIKEIEITDEIEAGAREQYWIGYYLKAGTELLNIVVKQL